MSDVNERLLEHLYDLAENAYLEQDERDLLNALIELVRSWSPKSVQIQTLPPTLGLRDEIRQLQAEVEGLRKSFSDAIREANRLGDLMDETNDEIDRLLAWIDHLEDTVDDSPMSPTGEHNLRVIRDYIKAGKPAPPRA